MARNDSLATMTVKIAANTAQFNAAIKQTQGQLSAFGNSVKNVASGLGAAFGAREIFNGVLQGVKIMADFEVQMSTVRAITGATGKEFEALEEDALKLGRSTKYTATQVGELQVAYGRLGFTTKEILAATGATLDLAAATGEDLAKSADVAGSTVRGFALDASETGRVVDVMASSFNKSALGLENFTESMKYVAPIANAANVSVEETTALLAVLADSGIRGSQAGTSLRKIFGDLTKDGRPLQDRLAELSKKGITLADSYDEVGRTAQTALLVLSKNTDKTGELTEAFRNASGEAAEMARIMSDNLTGDVTKLTSAFEGLILSMKEGSAPLRSATQSLTELLNVMSSDNVTAAQKFAIAMALISNPRAGFQGIEKINEVLNKVADNTEKAAKAQQEFITDSATVLLKDYGYDLTAITNALYDNKNAFEILAEVEKIHTGEVKKSAEAETERQRALALTLEKFKKLKEFQDAFRSAQEDQDILQRQNPKFSPMFQQADVGSFNPDDLVFPDPEEVDSDVQRLTDGLIVLRENAMKTKEAFAQLAVSICDSIGSAIQNEESFANVMISTTQIILDQIQKRIIANILLGTSKAFAANPILGIAVVGVAGGIIKGLLGKLRTNESSGGGTQYSNPNFQQYGMSTVRVYQRGTDMQGTLDESARLSKRTKG